MTERNSTRKFQIRLFSAIGSQLLRRTGSPDFWVFKRSNNLIFILLILATVLIFTTATPADALEPFFRDSETATTGQNSSINIPTPHAIEDDLLIAAITLLDPNSNPIYSLPSGWTLIRRDDASNLSQAVFYKIATASEPASYTFSYDQSVEAAGGIVSYWKADPFNPIDAHAGQYNGGSTPTAPSVTTSATNTTLLTIFGTREGTILAPPTGTTERWRASGVNGNQGFDESFTGSGATGSRTSLTNASSTIGQMIAIRPENIFPGSIGTVLFPTRATPPTSDGAELARIDFIKWLGYDVQQVYSRANTDTYNAALAQSDVVYISERVNTAEVSANLKNGCTGVVTEEMNLNDDFGIVSGNNQWGFYSGTDIYLKNPPTHYILQDFPAGVVGSYDIFGPQLSQDLQYLDDAPLPTSYDQLAFYSGDLTLPTLVAIETGDLLADGTIAAGRRVVLPWMQSASSADDFNAITVYGANILNRSLEWALADNECSFMQKRSFLPDGTPLASGTQVGVGTEVKFLIYINNKGSALSDISIQDILDPAFSYVPGTLQIDNTVSECANNTCTAAEEAAIFAAIDGNAYLTDSANGDRARYDSGSTTIDAGAGNVPGNGIVNVNANSVWALLFSVTLN